MGTATCYRNSRAPKRKPFKRRSLIDKEKTKEKIPACSTSQTKVSAASVSASAHKIKNNLVRNDIQMPKECYFIVNSQLLTDLLSVIGKCPQCLVSIDVNHLLSKNQGLSPFLNVICSKCGGGSDFCTSRGKKPRKW